MKKNYSLLLLSLLMLVASSFANPATARIPPQVSAQFVQDFSPLGHVTWQKIDFYYKASFDQQGAEVSAFYTAEGDFMGVGNYLSSSQLPEPLQTEIKKNYSGYWITDLFRYTNDETDGYVITLQNADQQLKLQAVGDGHWMVYKRQK